MCWPFITSLDDYRRRTQFYNRRGLQVCGLYRWLIVNVQHITESTGNEAVLVQIITDEADMATDIQKSNKLGKRDHNMLLLEYCSRGRSKNLQNMPHLIIKRQ